MSVSTLCISFHDIAAYWLTSAFKDHLSSECTIVFLCSLTEHHPQHDVLLPCRTKESACNVGNLG